MTVYIPLGESKRPIVKGWNAEDYEGVAPEGRVALRADDRVIIDCDSKEARDRWLARAGAEALNTYTVKTPRGWHFYYRWTPGSPTGPHAAVLGAGSGVDIRQGRGSYVVAPPTPGYVQTGSLGAVEQPFNPAWVPTREIIELREGEEWSEMPEGRGNTTMTAVAGALRKQGMDLPTMVKMLRLMNKVTMTENPMPDEDIVAIARSVSRYTPDPDIEIGVEDDSYDEDAPDDRDYREKMYMRARDFGELPPPPPWHWKPYLPDGRFVMLEGAEGIGKGMLAVWLAKLSVMGHAFPGEPPMEPAPVVWYSAEDDPEEDIHRRLRAVGWVPEDAGADIVFYNPRHKMLQFPKDIDHLRTVIEKVQPRFVIVDPGRSYLAPLDAKGEINYNSDSSMRPGLQALQMLAHDTHTTIIFVHHWNKSKNDGDTRQQSSGSNAFRQVPRHVIAMAQVNDHRAISVEKANNTIAMGTVLSVSVENDEATEAGWFKPGERLHDFRNLSEWIDTVTLLDNEVAHEIQTDMEWQDAALQYAYLMPGSVAPTGQQMMDDMGLTLSQAKEMRHELRRVGLIVGQGTTGRWGEMPPEIAEKARKVTGRA